MISFLQLNKVILRFSDDILTKVYQTPAWNDWYPQIKPILQHLGLKSSQIVRMMLARIPPGCHITMHHDTGRWTTRTHRMHIPVVTNPDVVFRVGPGPHHMKRYSFRSGVCYELNNRAKHEVLNGSQEEWRVHLIFDWIDEKKRGQKNNKNMCCNEQVQDNSSNAMDVDCDHSSDGVPLVVVPSDHEFQQTRRCLKLISRNETKVKEPSVTLLLFFLVFNWISFLI